MRTKLLPLMLGAALTLILAAAMACGSDDEAAPTPDTAAISAAVKAALPAPAPAPVSAAEIQQMVKGAISEIPAPDVPEQLSSAELQRLVEAAVAASAAGAAQPLSASEIQTLVSAAVEAASGEAATKGEIEALITRATEEAAEAAAAAAALAALAAVPTTVMAPAVAIKSDIQRGGTFTLGTPQQISNMDPHVVAAANHQNMKEGVYATHTRYGLDGLVGAHLFSSWEISSDLKTYTFSTQEGVKWHNGRDFTAEDHRLSIQRVIDIDSGYGREYKNLESLTVADDGTLVMVLPTANAVMAGNFFRTYLVAKENISNEYGGTAGGDDDFSHPIGTGPFTFVEFLPGESVTMDRFEDYWQMGEDGQLLPYLSRVVVQTIPDATSLLASLKTGEVQFYWQLPPRLFGALQFDKNADAVISRFSTTHFYMTFEHSRTTGDNVFADVRARRAVLLAIDKQEIVDVGYGGTARPILSNQYIPSNFPLGPKGFPDIERDVEEAKRLFAEVGLTEFHFQTWDDPAWTPIAEALQSQMAEAGVKVIIHIDRVADWSCAISIGDCGPDWKWPNMIGTNGSLSPPEPDLHIGLSWRCPGSQHDGKFCNEEMDKLSSAAVQTTDVEERKRLYREWNALWIEHVPAISYAQLPFYHGNHKSLHGIVNLFGMPYYEAAWLER